MKIRTWYWAMLGLWSLTAVPIYVIGQGFADRPLLSWDGLVDVLRPQTTSIVLFLMWIWMLYPAVALPFAIMKKRTMPIANSDSE